MTSPQTEFQTSRVIEKSPVFYGWIILIAGTVGIILSGPGQTFAFSIFLEEFIRELGISRTLVSTLYTVGTIGGSLALPFIGRQIDKRGSRTMAVVIGLTFGIACLYMSTVRNIAMLLIGFIAMRMLGQSSMVIVSRNVINQWWVKRRGFILGLSTLVTSISTGLLPRFINWLIPIFGWRITYSILGGIVISIMVPIGYIFFRDKPELFGLKPDGNFKPKKATSLTGSGNTQTTDLEHEEPLEVNWTTLEAVKTPAFWFILLANGSFSMLGTGLIFHMVSIFGDNGLSPDLAAAVFLPMSITTSLFSIPGGWLVDHIEAKYMLSIGLMLQVVTILFSASIGSPALGVLYGVVFGLTNGFARSIANVIWANYFGRENLGTISGLTTTFGAAASGIGPLIYGVGRDLSGSYWPTLWVSALLPATMALLVLFMKRPTKEA